MIQAHTGARGWQNALRSTSAYPQTDRQTIENQLRELRQIAERRGWEVVHEYHDAGIGGAKGREARPGLDEMLKDAQRPR
jgi:DNA invertase Pin-like site-specific DNA recombinase